MSGERTCRDCRKAIPVGRKGFCKCWSLSNVDGGWACKTHRVMRFCVQGVDNGKNTIDGKPSVKKRTKR